MDIISAPHLRSPIVFTLAGTQPDTRLKVFDDVEFRVHSVLLKAHSAFFGRFLDSPDKASDMDLSSASPVSGFKYEWVTKIDEDGAGWNLIAAPSTEVRSFSVFDLPKHC